MRQNPFFKLFFLNSRLGGVLSYRKHGTGIEAAGAQPARDLDRLRRGGACDDLLQLAHDPSVVRAAEQCLGRQPAAGAEARSSQRRHTAPQVRETP